MKWCDQWQSWVDEDECSIHADLCDDASCEGGLLLLLAIERGGGVRSC